MAQARGRRWDLNLGPCSPTVWPNSCSGCKFSGGWSPGGGIGGQTLSNFLTQSLSCGNEDCKGTKLQSVQRTADTYEKQRNIQKRSLKSKECACRCCNVWPPVWWLKPFTTSPSGTSAVQGWHGSAGSSAQRLMRLKSSCHLGDTPSGALGWVRHLGTSSSVWLSDRVPTSLLAVSCCQLKVSLLLGHLPPGSKPAMAVKYLLTLHSIFSWFL